MNTQSTEGYQREIHQTLLFVVIFYALSAALTSIKTRDAMAANIIEQCTWIFYTKAMFDLWNAEWYFDGPDELRIGVVQAYILLYILSQRNPSVGVGYVRQALVHALRVGLHKKDMYSSVNNKECELRRVLWWLVYMCHIDEADSSSIYVSDISVDAPISQGEFAESARSLRKHLVAEGHIII